MKGERNFVVDLEFNRAFLKFAKQMHLYTMQFPKDQKLSAVRELNDLRDEIYEIIVLMHYKQYKKTSLNDLRAKLSLMECKIEFFRDLGYFSYKKQASTEEISIKEDFIGVHRAGVLFDLLKPVGERAEVLAKIAMCEGKW